MSGIKFFILKGSTYCIEFHAEQLGTFFSQPCASSNYKW